MQKFNHPKYGLAALALWLAVVLPAQAQLLPGQGGTGSATSISPANLGVIVSPNPITGTGSFTVTRSSDNTTQTFALSSGAINQTAVDTFCGAYSGGVTANGCRLSGSNALYSMDPASNNAATFTNSVGARLGPVPHTHAQNGNMCLTWATVGGAETGLATNASMGTNPSGWSVYTVQKTTDSGAYTASYADYFYYTANDQLYIGSFGISPNAGLPDTTACHLSSGSYQLGDSPTGAQTYVDGALIDAEPMIDYPPITGFPTLDIGFFRYYEPAALIGDLCEIVVVAASATTGDQSRVHTFAQSNWGTP